MKYPAPYTNTSQSDLPLGTIRFAPGDTAAIGQPEAHGPQPATVDDDGIRIRFIENEKGNPIGKLADVEIEFHAGPLAGLRLIGFAVWESRRRPDGFNVTFPARQYSINGERRSFALLRPIEQPEATEPITVRIIDAWRAHAAGEAAI